MPLPNTQVIPDNWEAWHEPVVIGTMTGAVRVLRPDFTGTRDGTTGRTVFAQPTLIYEGPARVQKRDIGEANIKMAADRIATLSPYLVVVGKACPLVMVRDRVLILAAGGDPDAVGVMLDVTDVSRGTLTFERDISCTLYVPTARPS
jgi:hypothetical protein